MLHHDSEPSAELALNFVNVQEIWQLLNVLFSGLKEFLVGTGLVTLLVGAIGVMNIMLVVVSERTQEIGLRKAVGASNRAIFGQFLAEAVVVSALAGITGSLCGFGLIALSQRLSENDAVATQPLFDFQTTLTVALSLTFVGIVAGLLPAMRAARIPPAESLRACEAGPTDSSWVNDTSAGRATRRRGAPERVRRYRQQEVREWSPATARLYHPTPKTVTRDRGHGGLRQLRGEQSEGRAVPCLRTSSQTVEGDL